MTVKNWRMGRRRPPSTTRAPRTDAAARRKAAGQDGPAVLGGGGGDQEQGRLQALAGHGQEGHRHDGQAGVAVAGDGRVDAALELALDAVGLAPHPEDHPGEDGHGQQRHGREGEQPGLAPEVLDGEVDDDPGGDGQGGGRGHALPHGPDQVAAADPPDVGVDDGHDQRGLEALAEHDQQRGQHRPGPPATRERS
ncbi:MAG TPA: hypothetical protein VFO47_09065 [Actinomycetes bacterium]|nr:hypothetical protein [Actinomycetes bacterium]